MAKTALNNGDTFGVIRAALNAMLTEIYAALFNPTTNVQTGTSYVLALTDVIGVDMNNAAANTVTIPANATVPLPIGTQIPLTQLGAGATTVAAASGVTIVMPTGRSATISTQYETALLRKIATNTWIVYCN